MCLDSTITLFSSPTKKGQSKASNQGKLKLTGNHVDQNISYSCYIKYRAAECLILLPDTYGGISNKQLYYIW